MEKVQVLITAYAFTLIANLIIGAIQYQSNKAKIHLRMIVIWVTTLLILVCNMLFGALGSVASVLLAGSLFFIACIFHGSFFAQVADVKFPKTTSFGILGISYICFFVAINIGISLNIIIPFFILGCATPFFLSSYHVIKKRGKGGLSTPEIVYFLVQSCIALLNLTWSPENSAEYQLIGFTISLALGQLDALIVPVVAYNAIFKKRTDLLEEEIAERVQELSVAKEQLSESNKLASLGRMAGGVAHEINNPLSLIQLQINLIEKKVRRNDIASEFILEAMDHISSAVKRVTNLTLVMRRIAQDESSKKFVTFDMTSLINDFKKVWITRAEERGIYIQFEISEDKVMVSVDPAEIQQVLMSLFDNSLDAIENLPNKFIRVRVEKKAPFASFIIEDSGKIPPEHRVRLMEPFFTTKPVGKGIGLSLALSKSIIDSHRGKLFLDNKSEFTRFIVHLPLEQQ
ncbi:MAG: sensor histidine kinase [Bdellovibrio sp.]